MRFPDWSHFVKNLNYVIILRYKKSLSSGRSQRIGYYYQLSAVQDMSSPLEACDVEMLLAKTPTPAEYERILE